MNYLKKMFSKPITKEENSNLKLNLKGQQVSKDRVDFNSYTFRNELKISEGTHMFSTRTRIKIWGTLGAFMVYVFLLYSLMKYRLKADDLDIMEREVKDEYEIRRKVKEFNSNK